MADRRQQVLQLLATRYDQLYLPAGALRTPSGLSPAKKIPCPDCGHLEHPGTVTDAFKRQHPCAKCGAKGHIFVDPMDSLEVPVGSAETVATARPRKVVTCDRCAGEGVWKGERCELCDGQGARPQHIFELHLDTRESSGDPMTDAIDRRNQSGSYRELDLALAGIRVHQNKHPKFHWLTLNATWTLRLIDELTLNPPKCRDLEHGIYPHEVSKTAQNLVELALDYLQSRLPDPIRVPSEVRANAKITAERRTKAKGRGSDPAAHAQREREMRQHARQGRSPQWIAAEYGVSVRVVYEVVNTRRSA